MMNGKVNFEWAPTNLELCLVEGCGECSGECVWLLVLVCVIRVDRNLSRAYIRVNSMYTSVNIFSA